MVDKKLIFHVVMSLLIRVNESMKPLFKVVKPLKYFCNIIMVVKVVPRWMSQFLLEYFRDHMCTFHSFALKSYVLYDGGR